MLTTSGTAEASKSAGEGPLLRGLAGFIDHLRLNGFVVGVGETEAIADLLASEGFDLTLARPSLKVLLASNREEWERFDALYEAYWLGRGRQRQPGPSNVARKLHPDLAPLPQAWQQHLGQVANDRAPQLESGDEPSTGSEASGRLIAARTAARARVDLRRFADAGEIAEAEVLAYRLARSMSTRLSRRWRLAHRGRRIDIRRSIRANLGHGGTMLELFRKARPERPVRIIAFVDVSGSMQHYSRFFLQFVKGLVGQWADTDAYLFHTRLVRVTDAMRERNATKAMMQLSLLAEGFGGGTKLAESLAAFNARYAKRAVNSRTVLMVFSDGYDTGSPAALAAELATLRKRVPRLVWLNPLLGWANYRPVAASMAAAMPYIDHFAAANTIGALAAMETDLARLWRNAR
ncbi:MAG: vWA domain-containing protein [Devosia sp.]